jgi:hypothetical protein
MNCRIWTELDGGVMTLMALTWTPECCADSSSDYVTGDASDYESGDCDTYDDIPPCGVASFSTGKIAAYGGTLKVEACS